MPEIRNPAEFPSSAKAPAQSEFSLSPQPVRNTDWDRNVTFCLSVATIMATAGLGLAYAVWHVCRVARFSCCESHKAGPILVLGARLIDEQASPEFEMRLARALRILDGQRVILLGGRPGHALLSEAAVGRDWLVRRGVPESAITVEEGSSHTLENLREARTLLGDTAQDRVVLVSSRYHLARCGILATALGIPHQLCGAEDRFILHRGVIWRIALEGFFIHWFFVGRLWARLIGSSRMQDRVR